MAAPRSAGAGRLVALIVAAVAVGIPLLAYLWDTLDQLLAGRVNPARLGVSLAILVVFAGVLLGLARGITRLTAAPAAATEEEPVVSGTLFLTAILVMFMFGVWIVVYDFLLRR